MKKILLGIFLILATTTFAGYSYDPYTGNSYTTYDNYDGGATVQGYNYNTGSQWRTQIQPNGNMSGTDSNNNYWSYNASTNFYYNSDGTTCTGTGFARSCS